AAVWGRPCPGCATYPTIADASLIAVSAWGNGAVALRADGVMTQIGSAIPMLPAPAARPYIAFASISAQNYDVVKTAVGNYHVVFLRADGSVSGFGDNYYKQISLPAEATCGCVVDVAAGQGYTMILRDDGTVYAWGSITLADGAAPVLVSTVAATAGVTNAVRIGAGARTMYALKNDGTMSYWGAAPDAASIATLNGLTDVVDFAAWGFSGIAIKGDGTVVGWGSSPYFTAGMGGAAFSVTNAVAVSVGLSVGLVLRDDGTVVAYGYPENTYRQKNVPAAVQNAFAVAAGDSIAIALNNEPLVTTIGAALPTSGGDLTLSGEALTGVTRVYLDRVGSPLPFSATDTSLTVNLPRHAHGAARLLLMSVTEGRVVVPITYNKTLASSTPRVTKTALSTRTNTATFTASRTPTITLTRSKTPTVTRSLTPTRTRTPCLICP
ncbi:MAG: hypothetical protein RLZZ297_159, partial [Chloroflexota bacterium]